MPSLVKVDHFGLRINNCVIIHLSNLTTLKNQSQSFFSDSVHLQMFVALKLQNIESFSFKNCERLNTVITPNAIVKRYGLY